MAVEFELYNNKDEKLDAVNLGNIRRGHDTIYELKLKNAGTTTARNVVISAETLNNSSEVSEEEFGKQKNAKNWKSFSLKKNGVYTSSLNLGDIKAGRYLEGENNNVVSFLNENACILKTKWTTGTSTFEDGKLKLEKSASVTSCSRRMTLESLGITRNVDVTFNIDINSKDVSETTLLLGFPVRIGNDGYGYMVNFQFKKSDCTYLFSVYKNAKGMISDNNKIYGNKMFDTLAYKPFDPTKDIGFKVYNNDDDVPCFEIYYDGQPLMMKNSTTGEMGKVMKDNDLTYVDGGKIYFDSSITEQGLSFSINNYFYINSMKIISDDIQKLIYIKTLADDKAENKLQYSSAINIEYGI